jgi:hypothetical protein
MHNPTRPPPAQGDGAFGARVAWVGAGHGDQHAARRVIEDAFDEPDDERAAPAGEPDTEHEPDA